MCSGPRNALRRGVCHKRPGFRRVLHSTAPRRAGSMALTLVVPRLLDLPAATLASIDASAPALSRLLASGAPAANEPDGAIAAACRACGIERQDDWPVAPRLARALGIEPGRDYWLCAEPATLAVGADDVRLSSFAHDLAPEQAQALVATLNGHFAADGVAFVAASPGRWFVRAARAQRLVTRPPEAALGAPLFAFLPSGADAPRWRRWQNEAQMLLFEHPVNVERERAGDAPVNSVWLWGGGIDAPRGSAARAIFASASRVVELARGSAVEVRPPPESFEAVDGADAWIWLDEIEPGAAAGALATLERAWMAPAERALDAGRVKAMAIVATGRARALTFRPRRSSLARRWRARLSPPRSARLLAAAQTEAG